MIAVVETDATLCRLYEAIQATQERGFPGARWTDQRERRAAVDFERDVREDREPMPPRADRIRHRQMVGLEHPLTDPGNVRSGDDGGDASGFVVGVAHS